MLPLLQIISSNNNPINPKLERAEVEVLHSPIQLMPVGIALWPHLTNRTLLMKGVTEGHLMKSTFAGNRSKHAQTLSNVMSFTRGRSI